MSRKRKDLPIIENVEIVDVAAEGKSLARVDDMVVFDSSFEVLSTRLKAISSHLSSLRLKRTSWQ